MIWLFLSLWAVLFFLSALAIAAVPTTEAKPNSMLIGPLIWTGVFAAVVTLIVAGAYSLIS